MKYPNRAASHISETASEKILAKCIPDEWMIRETTERDYGIDFFVEIVERTGDVRGDIFLLQLKCSDVIPWKEPALKSGSKARFNGIKRSTVNYWMGLPIPVFLMWAEQSTGKLFFVSVKEQVRQQYSAFLNQNQHTMGFEFDSQFYLDGIEDNSHFLNMHSRECSYKRFSFYLTGLVIHSEHYFNFIHDRNLDCFYEIETDRHLMFRHIYNTCHFLSQFLQEEWNVDGLEEVYKSNKETFKTLPHAELHEGTLTNILEQLEPVYNKILKRAKKLVVEEQKDYWIEEDNLLYTMCEYLYLEE